MDSENGYMPQFQRGLSRCPIPSPPTVWEMGAYDVFDFAFRKGEAPKETKAGEASYLAPNVVHRGMNKSNAPVKLFVVVAHRVVAAFSLAGSLAGLAGYLWGTQTGFVNPELMGFQMSAHAIVMVILGGMGNFAGAIIGAFAFEYLLLWFKDLPALGAVQLGKHWQLWMGLFIVLVVTFVVLTPLFLGAAIMGSR